MVVSVFSPCLHCDSLLPGIQCGPRHRVRCSEFLEYIQKLNRIREHHILINELKALLNKGDR